MLPVASNQDFIRLPADALHEAVESIWNSILELEIQRAEESPADFPADEPLLTGQVTIHGGWQGRVVLVCPRAIARKAAAAMFKIPPLAISETGLRDTIGELTHMLGCNLKSLLPSPSRVSLPVVTGHYNNINIAITGRPAGRALLRCEGQPLQISLFEQE
jgi:chemotaxis protein CheX